MTQEKKELLLQDICGRLPYGVKVQIDFGEHCVKYGIDRYVDDTVICVWHETFEIGVNDEDQACDIEDVKPYLRPMSSMTNDERFEYLDFLKVEIQDGGYVTENYVVSLADMPMLIDWLLKHHFDYRGLIKMGLALEAPEGMYKEEDELPEPPETDLYRYKNEESI